jgi:hypothetical protein
LGPEDYGDIVLRVSATRAGVLLDQADREVQLFWRLVGDDSDESIIDLRDDGFAKGLNLQETIVPEVLLQLYNDNSPYFYQNTADPNWLFFWLRQPHNPFAVEFSQVSPRYVFSDRPAFGLAPHPARELAGLPNNLILLLDRAYVPIKDPTGRATGDHLTHGRAFAYTVHHEHCHVRNNVNWSARTRRIHIEDELLRAAPSFGDPIGQWDWAGSKASESYTAYFDFANLKNGFSHNLECDLNGDGVIGRIREDQVGGHNCIGIINHVVDVDGDGDFVSLIDERDIEDLDWDDDGLPNWADEAPYNPEESNSEDVCYAAGFDLVTACLLEPCQLGEFSAFDWSAGGPHWSNP